MSALFILPRWGDSPLSINGTLLVQRSTLTTGMARWHTIRLFRTDDRRWAIHVAYESSWDCEPPWHDAAVLDTPEAVRDYLRAYEPCAHVLGYPPRPVYRERQERLLATLRDRFAGAVAEVLSAHPALAAPAESS